MKFFIQINIFSFDNKEFFLEFLNGFIGDVYFERWRSDSLTFS